MGWRISDLTARTGAPLAVTDPFGYEFAQERTQHVIYLGGANPGFTNHHVNELFWDGVGWRHRDHNAESDFPLTDSIATGYAFEQEGTQHIIYRGFVPGHGGFRIHELWRNQNDGDWHHSDLSSDAHAPDAIERLVGYESRGDGIVGQNIVYEGNDGRIHHLANILTGEWIYTNLTAASGVRKLADFGPAAYWAKFQETHHVVFWGRDDSHVHELWWRGKHTASSTSHNDLTARTGAPPAGGPPSGFAFDAGRSQFVHYRGGDLHIHQLRWEDDAWHHLDLTATAGGPLAASGIIRPDGYVFPFEGTLHVVYLGDDRHIHEFWRDTDGTWHHNDLTTTAGAPLASSNPTAYVFSFENTQHVVFTSDSGHIIELFWVHDKRAQR